jgi:hypothetical protein
MISGEEAIKIANKIDCTHGLIPAAENEQNLTEIMYIAQQHTELVKTSIVAICITISLLSFFYFATKMEMEDEENR